jgi:hypothetical protein
MMILGILLVLYYCAPLSDCALAACMHVASRVRSCRPATPTEEEVNKVVPRRAEDELKTIEYEAAAPFFLVAGSADAGCRILLCGARSAAANQQERSTRHIPSYGLTASNLAQSKGTINASRTRSRMVMSLPPILALACTDNPPFFGIQKISLCPRRRLAGRPLTLHFVYESPSQNPLHHMATKSFTPRRRDPRV